MKTFTTLIFLLSFLSTVYSQDSTPQQKVDYQLNITLQDKKHLVDGDGTITYHNNSDQTLDTIYFQLISNAFKSKTTNFAKDLVKNGIRKMELAGENEMGGYNYINFSVNSIDLQQVEKKDIETIGLVLKTPLLSGDKLEIDVKYQIKLPLFFNPKDKKNKVFKLFDIYPAPHVYTNGKWYISPFTPTYYPYKEYGNFDIKLKLKQNFKIASSGEIVKTSNSSKNKGKNTWKTVNIKADNINNFALITSPNFIINSETIQINNKEFTYNVFYTKKNMPKKDFYENIPEVLLQHTEQFGSIPFSKLDIVYDQLSLSYSGLIVLNSKKRYKTKQKLKESLFDMLLVDIVSFYSNDEKNISNVLSPSINYSSYYSNRRFFSKSRLGMLNFSNINPSKFSYTSAKHISDQYIQKMLKAYVGSENYNRILRSFFEEYEGKHTNSKAFEQFIQKNTEKDISVFFNNSLFTDKQMDYALVSSNKNNNTYEVTLENKGGLALPIQLSAFSDVSIVYDSIIDGFQGTKTITIETKNKIKEFFLDKNHNSLDNDISNNYLKTSGLFKKNGIFKPSFLRRITPEKYGYQYTNPLIGYNKIDGLQLMIVSNTSTQYLQHWNYLLAPSYGISSKDIVGLNQLSYSWFNPTKKFQIIELGYEYKSYHFQRYKSKLLKADLRYQRLAPFIKFILRKPNNKRLYHAITFKSILLLKDGLKFIEDNPLLIKNQYNRYDRIEHEFIDKTSYYPIDIRTELEFHQYNDAFVKKQSYLKLSSTLKTNIYYKANKKVDFRLFAAGFLLNSNRNTNSYNNSLSHGSISLFSQGNHDYTFDGYYVDRLNRDSKSIFIDRSQFGGFGVGTNSAYNYGYSNSYAVALNIKAQLPIKLPLSIYADFGLVNQPSLSSDMSTKNSFLYTSGIEIDLFDGGIEVLFPILSSENIHNALLEEGGYFKRISISIGIDKLRFKEMMIKNLFLY